MEKNKDLQKKLSETNEYLLNSSDPAIANVARLEKDLEEAKSKIQHLEKRHARSKTLTDIRLQNDSWQGTF